MRIFTLLFISLFITNFSFAQIPKSGTYIYSFCDIEYKTCVSKCKVVIKGKKIWIYAPSGLTGIKEGALFDSGMLVKHDSNKWIVSNRENNEESKNLGQPSSWVDFKKKQFWRF